MGINMPQLLLDVMDREYPSFDALFDALFDKLDSSIKANFEEQNAIRKIRNDNSQNPLLSCFVNDCLKMAQTLSKAVQDITGLHQALWALQIL